MMGRLLDRLLGVSGSVSRHEYIRNGIKQIHEDWKVTDQERAEWKARCEEMEGLLREARKGLNSWNTQSEAVDKGCPCSACQNTRTQRAITALLGDE